MTRIGGLALILALGVAGCGDSGGGQTLATSPSTSLANSATSAPAATGGATGSATSSTSSTRAVTTTRPATTTSRTPTTAAVTTKCEFQASIVSINIGSSEVPITSSTVTFECDTVAANGAKTVVAKNARGVKIDVKKESTVLETADRQALVDELKATLRQSGWREVGQGDKWYSWIYGK